MMMSLILRYLRYLQIGAVAFAISISLLALVGWIADLPLLAQLHPALPPLRPLNAGMLLIATLMLLVPGRLTRLLAGVMIGSAVVLGVLYLSTFLWDGLVPVFEVGSTGSPLAFVPMVILTILLVGVAIFLRENPTERNVRLAQLCALGLALYGLIAIMSFLPVSMNLRPLARGTSLHGSVAVLLLALAGLTMNPDRGFMVLSFSESQGGQILRRLVAGSFVLLLIGWLVAWITWQTGFSGAILGLIMVIIGNLILFYQVAHAFERADQERTQAEKRLEMLNRDLEYLVRERTDDLEEREAQLGAISDNLPGVMLYQELVVDNGPGRFTYVSAGVEQLSGSVPAQALNKPELLYELLVPEDRQRLYEAEQQARAAFAPLDMEVRKMTPWGERWSRIRQRPRRLDAHHVLWDGIEMDITSQKQAQVKIEQDRRYQAALFACSQILIRPVSTLAEREQVLREALVTLLDGIEVDRIVLLRGVRDPELGLCLDQTITIARPAFLLPPHQPLPRLPWNKIPAQFRIDPHQGRAVSGTIESLRTQAPELAALMEPLGIASFLFLTMHTGEDLASALGFYHCTTAQRWQEQDYILLQLATGLIGSTLRRWKNEEELRESESLLRTLFDILPVGVSIVDPKRRPIQLNRTIGQILGMEVSEILAGGYRQIQYIYPDGAPIPFAAFPTIRATNGEIVRDAEIGIIRPDGKLRWASISAAPLPVAGMGAAIVTLDITARKESEAQRELIQRKLLEAQRLESLTILAGGMAHDFNNILSTILGYAELARFDTPPGSEVHDSLNAIMLGARRAAELTAQMLAYAGRGAFHLVPVDLNLIVREQSELISLTLPHTIAIHYHLEPDLPQIYGDETQLRQMLRSLLTNAIEAIEAIEHGVITVTTGQWDVTEAILRQASINAAHPGRYAYLEVHDTGCGIEAVTIRRIFDPFFSTKFTGRGLGLAAVQGIVQAHHGALIVESEPTQGSRFRICLPFATNE